MVKESNAIELDYANNSQHPPLRWSSGDWREQGRDHNNKQIPNIGSLYIRD